MASTTTRLDAHRQGLWAVCESLDMPWATWDSQSALLPRLWVLLGGAAGESHVLVEISASYVVTKTLLDLTALETLYLPLVVLLSALQAQSGGGGAHRRLLAGFTGAAASGKTTLTEVVTLVANAWSRAAREAGLLGSGEDEDHDGPWCQCLSMDAYHLRNAELESRGLRSVKGSRPTIDGEAFATDLERCSAAAIGRASPVVTLPAYDRRTTHDPVADAFTLAPSTRILLVEGLFLCTGGDRLIDDVGREGGPEADARAAQAAADAWGRVRASLDVAYLLDVPMSVCRDRAVRRRGLAGVPAAAARAHFDRVDAPTHRAMRAWTTGKPPAGALDALFLAHAGNGNAVAGRAAHGAAGVDAVLHLRVLPHPSSDAAAGSPSSSGVAERVGLVRVTLRRSGAERAASCCAIPQAGAGRGGGLLVTGLAPCIQRTLVFGGSSEKLGGSSSGGSVAAAPSQEGWRRGGVNRAEAAHVTVGGKGQHCAMAFARASRSAAAAAPAPLPTVALAMFVGGEPGRTLLGMLSSDAGPLAAAAARFEPIVQDLGEGSPTRTCVTLVDRVLGDSTELIEPSALAPPAACDALLAATLAAVHGPGLGGGAAPYAIAVMGSSPPGAEAWMRALLGGLPRSRCGCRCPAAASAAAAAAAAAAAPTTVLIDGYKGTVELLRACTSAPGGGPPVVLKVNADELRHVAADLRRSAAAAAAAGEEEAGDDDACTLAAEVLWLARRAGTALEDGEGEDCPNHGLCAVGVTDGPRPASLAVLASSALGMGLGRGRGRPEGDGGGDRQRSAGGAIDAFRYAPVPLPPGAALASPIGAGDAVAGATLAALAAGAALPLAFARGLAAGSASCATWVGAAWDEDAAAALVAGETWAVERIVGV